MANLGKIYRPNQSLDWPNSVLTGLSYFSPLKFAHCFRKVNCPHNVTLSCLITVSTMLPKHNHRLYCLSVQNGSLLAAGSRDRYLNVLDLTKLESGNPESVKNTTVFCDPKAHKVRQNICVACGILENNQLPGIVKPR